MSISRSIAKQLKRHAPQEHFPPVGFEDGLFFLEDTEKRSYLGACFIGHPLSGIDPTTFEKFRNVLSSNFPPDTFIQCHLMSVPDIDESVYNYAQPKYSTTRANPALSEDQRDILLESIERRAEFFLSGKEMPHVASTGIRNHRVIQIFSIKVPTQVRPTEREQKEISEIADKFEQSLFTTGFNISRCTAGAYLSVLRLMFDPWNKINFTYDDDEELREQILPVGYNINYENTKQLSLGADIKVRMLSVNRYPKMAGIGLMNMVSGDPGGINNQFPVPWCTSLSIRYPDHNKKKAWFSNKHRALDMQARGQVAKWVPRIGLKKASFDAMAMSLEKGDRFVESSFTMTLYSHEERELTKLSSQMCTFMSGFGLDLKEDSEILWPLFWNTLPLFPSDTSIFNLCRYSSMMLRSSLQFAPVLGEWTGTGTAALLLETRRGQPFAYNLYDSPTNFNALTFAESGAGKSVFLNSLINDYLAMGAKVWVVDIGRSYYKTVKALGGEFWTFTEDSDICLNPFTFVLDIDDEMDVLKSLLAKMAAPTEGLSDFHMARLQEAIKAVWGRMGNAMTVTEVADYMSGQEDLRIKDIGHMLFAFTRYGQFGHWFDGEANLKFDSNFIVLELEELGQKEHLQQIVLMILMSKIQHEMYLAGDRMMKIALFDEAWALFSDEGVARFLNHSFRRFRKYRGSAILAVQSLSDFYNHPQMGVVAENAATRFILQQMPESIEAVVESGRLSLDEYGKNMLKSVHTVPGQYSEIMIHTGRSYAITRLTLPRFNQVLYSTSGDERDLIIKAIEQGMPAKDAINLYLEQRG